jgi:hypothetical protein
VRAVHAGLRAVDPALAAEAIADGTSPLTPREEEVLAAAAFHGTAAEIAAALQPLRGHRAQLPERRDAQARRPQPPRGGRRRHREGLALEI